MRFTRSSARKSSSAPVRRDIDAVAVRHAAAQRAVEVLELSRHGARPLARDGLVLGFAAVDETEIERGVKELAGILKATQRAQRARA